MVLGIERCFKRRSISGRVFLFIFSSLAATGLLLNVFNSTNYHQQVDTPLMYSIEQTEETSLSTSFSERSSQSEDERRMCIPFPVEVDKWTMYTVARQQLKPINNQQPLFPYCGNVFNDVNFRFTINPMDRCGKPEEGKTNRSVFIAILSAPNYFDKRFKIRRSWIQQALDVSSYSMDVNIDYGFFLGRTNNSNVQAKIDVESQAFGDIIQVDMNDTYVNLNQKMVAILRWTTTHCHEEVQFILKTDDDIFVNVYNLVEVLKVIPTEPKAVYGFALPNKKPYRGTRTKWTMSNETWPWEVYPPYLIGAGYMISRTALNPLLAAASTTPYFVFEDLYLNGLCAPKAHVQLRSLSFKQFVSLKSPKNQSARSCFVRDTVVWVSKNMNVSKEATEDFFVRKITPCFQEKESTDAEIIFKTLNIFP